MCCKVFILLIEFCCMMLIFVLSVVICCICGGFLVFFCVSLILSKWICLNFLCNVVFFWFLKFVVFSVVLNVREWVFSCFSRVGMVLIFLF